ncbi:Hypothetical protein F387_00040 [Wohlfahrtiimonas chitiniclastica SH04]|uniref:Uncharacterized protein n=1 Tax=Wohlfahrtiimonas chitiniclastica SH04 TaxID=1261130 RepID=L8XX86_9GAMM|nr:Hypothetical protein F387_00040 [Wohlfahrtiimonas chitiniclastica SH04]
MIKRAKIVEIIYHACLILGLWASLQKREYNINTFYATKADFGSGGLFERYQRILLNYV